MQGLTCGTVNNWKRGKKNTVTARSPNQRKGRWDANYWDAQNGDLESLPAQLGLQLCRVSCCLCHMCQQSNHCCSSLHRQLNCSALPTEQLRQRLQYPHQHRVEITEVWITECIWLERVSGDHMYFNSLFKTGQQDQDCIGIYPVGFWISPRMKTSVPCCATMLQCLITFTVKLVKITVKTLQWNFLYFHLCKLALHFPLEESGFIFFTLSKNLFIKTVKIWLWEPSPLPQ